MVILLLFLNLLSPNGFGLCLDIEKFKDEIALKAYQKNMTKVVGQQVLESKVPICYRDSTEAAQIHQQNNLETKPQAVKNKSSTLLEINGLIPCEGADGKLANSIRKNSIKNKKDWINEPISAGELLHQMETLSRIKKENDLRDNLIQNHSEFDCVPIHKEFNGSRRILAYTNAEKTAMQWVDAKIPPPLPVRVMSRNGRVMAPDTDAVLVGIPKDQDPSIMHDSVYGYRTSTTDQVIRGLNTKWKNQSKNSNEPYQHADEGAFGLNPIDDLYQCHGMGAGHTTEHRSFDLRASNPHREQAMIEYAKWLHKQSEYAHIPIPDEKLLKNRHDYLLNHYGISLPYEKNLKEYNLIRNIVYPPGGPRFTLSDKFKEVDPPKVLPLGDSDCEKGPVHPQTGQQCTNPLFNAVEKSADVFGGVAQTILGPGCSRVPNACSSVFRIMESAPHEYSLLEAALKELQVGSPSDSCHLFKNLDQLDEADKKAAIHKLLHCAKPVLGSPVH